MEILTNTSAVITTLLALGLVPALFRSYFRYEDEKKRVDVTKTAQLFFVGTSLFLLVLLFFARPLSELLLGDEDLYQLLVVVLISIIFTNLLSVPFAVLRANSQSIRFTVYSLIQFAVNIAFTVLLVVVAKHGVLGNFEGLVIGQAAVLLLFTGMFIRMIKAKFNWEEGKEMLSYGLPLMPAMLAYISLAVADRYFLRAYASLDEVGVYALGYKFGMIISLLIVTPFMRSWGPVMWSVADKKYARRFFEKTFTYFVLVGLFIVLAVSILSPEVIQIISQRESYYRAWTVVPLIALSYLFFGTYYLLSVGINLKKKTKYVPIIVGGAALLNLALNYVLIPSWDMMGAAVATIISYAVLAVLAYSVSQRFYPLSYEWGRILKVSLVFIILLAIGYQIFIGSIYLTILVKMVFLISFPAALLLIRFFTPDELKRFPELMKIAYNTILRMFNRSDSKSLDNENSL